MRHITYLAYFLASFVGPGKFATCSDKMQSDTADFTPGTATLRNGRNICVVFDSGVLPRPPFYANMTSSI